MWEVESTDELEEWWLWRWYEWAIPAADNLYDIHLQELRDEGLLDDDTTD